MSGTEMLTADLGEASGDGSVVAGFDDGDFLSSSLVGERGGHGTSIGVGEGGRCPAGAAGSSSVAAAARTGEPNRATQRTEAAVLYGLTWLARHQMADGSWDAVAFQGSPRRCLVRGRRPCALRRRAHRPALLAFLGAGYSHESRQFVIDPSTHARLVLGQVVKNGLRYLVDRQQPDGSFGPDSYMYNQAICGMALCEAYGLSGARFFREPAARAIAFLQSAQNDDPTSTGLLGWRYAPRGGDRHVGDRPVRDGAQVRGARGPAGQPRGARGRACWVKRCTGSEGKTGYLSVGDAGQKIENQEELGKFDHHESMTAVGMMVRTFTTFDWRDPAMEKGAAHLVADLPTWEPASKRDYYYWYYASLALNQYAGPDSPNPNKTWWSRWNEKLVAALVAHQENVSALADQTYATLFTDALDHACKTGSFAPTDRYGYAGRVYATALNVLTLEVYYRFDNAFGGRLDHAGGGGRMPRER
ncbi:MAG: prenyltransferase/squalene oxidase repeat-containing protein [Planctomycetota bacterium]